MQESGLACDAALARRRQPNIKMTVRDLGAWVPGYFYLVRHALREVKPVH